MPKRSAIPPGGRALPQTFRRRGSCIALAVAIETIASAHITLAPPAVADAIDSLKAAVTASRAGSSCGPFRSDPVVDRVAEVINKSVNDWLDHTATHAPIEDPRPGLKELGYRGSKGVFVGGVSKKTDADAIKGALLEGYDKIPDCSYTDLGVSMRRNEGSGFYLVALVLAGA